MVSLSNDKILDYTNLKMFAHDIVNPLPDMPILGSSNSAVNTDMV